MFTKFLNDFTTDKLTIFYYITLLMVMHTNLIKLSRSKKIHPSRKMITRKKQEFMLMEMRIMRAKITDV